MIAATNVLTAMYLLAAALFYWIVLMTAKPDPTSEAAR